MRVGQCESGLLGANELMSASKTQAHLKLDISCDLPLLLSAFNEVWIRNYIPRLSIVLINGERVDY